MKTRLWSVVNFPKRCPCNYTPGLCLVMCANERCGNIVCELFKWAIKNNAKYVEDLTDGERAKLNLAKLLT